jgi:hypothetical protein
MSNTAPEGFLKAIPKIAKPTASASSVTITGQAWDNLPVPKTKKTSYQSKPIEEWNRRDVVAYFYKRYFDQYHARISSNIPWMKDFQIIEETMVMLQKQLKVEAGVQLLKQYYDWCFDGNIINDILSRKNSKFGLFDLQKEKPVLLFCQSLARGSIALPEPLPKVAPKIETPTGGFTFDDLVSAHKIHSQFFVQNYGLLLPVNYLILVKGKSEEEAVQYVQKAVDKYVTSKPLTSLVQITKKFEPYPKWLPFLDIRRFAEAEVGVSDDNEVFKALRRKVN